jgi:hypothetical protein
LGATGIFRHCACKNAIASSPGLEVNVVNLVIWTPALFALGLVAMAAMFAFVYGCDKV